MRVNALLPWTIFFVHFHGIAKAFHWQQQSQPRYRSDHGACRRNIIRQRSVAKDQTETQDQRQGANVELLLLNKLEGCKSGTSARRILEAALAGSDDQYLYGSVIIPTGASDRSISDGDLAIQTKIRNKKYGIFDLIDLNGDRDADRIRGELAVERKI